MTDADRNEYMRVYMQDWRAQRKADGLPTYDRDRHRRYMRLYMRRKRRSKMKRQQEYLKNYFDLPPDDSPRKDET